MAKTNDGYPATANAFHNARISYRPLAFHVEAVANCRSWGSLSIGDRVQTEERSVRTSGTAPRTNPVLTLFFGQNYPRFPVGYGTGCRARNLDWLDAAEHCCSKFVDELSLDGHVYLVEALVRCTRFSGLHEHYIFSLPKNGGDLVWAVLRELFGRNLVEETQSVLPRRRTALSYIQFGCHTFPKLIENLLIQV
jgi:hypothetical protein